MKPKPLISACLLAAALSMTLQTVHAQNTKPQTAETKSEKHAAAHAEKAAKPKISGFIAKPFYPPSALEKGITGTVVLAILVNPQSEIEEVKVVESSGYSELDEAAVDAARHGRFQTNAWVSYKVPVRFGIDESEACSNPKSAACSVSVETVVR